MSRTKAAPGNRVPARRSSLALQSALLADVRSLIDRTRDVTARAVNSALVLLYWSIGDRIRREVLKEKRAGYGEEILATLSQELVAEYGRGYAEKNLRRMVQLAEVFPTRDIVVTLSRQLGWSHFIALIPLKDQLKRDFYAEMCRVERWSVRTLRQKINGMLFERTALSRKPEKLAAQELDKLRTTDRLPPAAEHDSTVFDPEAQIRRELVEVSRGRLRHMTVPTAWGPSAAHAP